MHPQNSKATGQPPKGSSGVSGPPTGGSGGSDAQHHAAPFGQGPDGGYSTIVPAGSTLISRLRVTEHLFWFTWEVEAGFKRAGGLSFRASTAWKRAYAARDELEAAR